MPLSPRPDTHTLTHTLPIIRETPATTSSKGRHPVIVPDESPDDSVQALVPDETDHHSRAAATMAEREEAEEVVAQIQARLPPLGHEHSPELIRRPGPLQGDEAELAATLLSSSVETVEWDYVPHHGVESALRELKLHHPMAAEMAPVLTSEAKDPERAEAGSGEESEAARKGCADDQAEAERGAKEGPEAATEESDAESEGSELC